MTKQLEGRTPWWRRPEDGDVNHVDDGVDREVIGLVELRDRGVAGLDVLELEQRAADASARPGGHVMVNMRPW